MTQRRPDREYHEEEFILDGHVYTYTHEHNSWTIFKSIKNKEGLGIPVKIGNNIRRPDTHIRAYIKNNRK